MNNKVKFICLLILFLCSESGNIFAENDKDIIDKKYLITNNSAGYFKIGSKWREFAKKYYDYDYTEGITRCVDACCWGGYFLGKNIIVDKNGNKRIKDVDIIIGAESADENTNTGKIRRDNYFYIESDNCKGWYYKDKINYIDILSDLYKTSEGIGVGTTLEIMKKRLSNLKVHVGWLEEDDDALYITTNKYPNIRFIVDIHSYNGDLESFNEMKLNLSKFRKNTAIEKIRIIQE